MTATFRRRSIRMNMLLLALMILLPVTAMLTWFLVAHLQHTREDARAKVNAIAENVKLSLEVVLNDHEAVLTRLAARPLVRSLDARKFDPVVNDFIAIHPEYNNLGVRDIHGNNIYSYRPNPTAPQKAQEFPWFQEGIHSKVFLAGNAFLGKLVNRWVTVLTYPVRDDAGDISGFLNLPLDLLTLNAKVFKAIPKDALVAVTDRADAILLRSSNPATVIGKPAIKDAIDAMHGMREGYYSIADRDGVKRQFAFVTMPGVGWRIAAGLPESTIYAEYNMFFRIGIAAELCVLALAFWLAWCFSEPIVGPIASLAATAAKVAAGDVAVRAKIVGPVEIEAVAQQFNRMLDVRDQNEASLRESELRTQRLLKAANVGLWEWNLVTQEVYFSAEWKSQLGYADNELANRLDEWRERIHPSDLESTLAAVQDFREGRRASYEVEFRMRHRSGEWRWIVARADLMRNAAGEPVRMMGSHTDITERTKARQAIRELAARQAAIIDASMDAIIVVDESERILIFSAAAERLFNLPAGEIIGQQLERFIPMRHRAGHHAHMRDYGESGATTRKMGQFSRLTALRHDGTEFPIEASIAHIPTDDGKLFTVTLRDITERETAEAARASLEVQLRESQKMEAIGTLAGGIAHDFNNIIVTILGNAELASEDASDNPPALQSIEEIRKAGTRARDLVQQILSFSRRQPTEKKRIALAPVIEESARLLRATLPARLSLDVRCAPDVPPVLADATQVLQIVMNLATNAMHAMRGYGRIEIRLDTVVLDAAFADAHPQLRALHDQHPGRTVRLAVGDTGSGMDAATLERVFEPFFTTKAVDEGTGLGLSVVHGIVQTHEGAITVDSAPGNGTTFTLYLPVATATANAAPTDGAAFIEPAVSHYRGKHILYLDDDDAMVSMVTRLLERRGFRVSGYSTSSEALAALRDDPAAFDLVVSDYNMPGISGLDVARVVRSIRVDLPVAVASGFVDEELETQAVAAGVCEVIYKARAVDEFCEIVQRLAQTGTKSPKPS